MKLTLELKNLIPESLKKEQIIEQIYRRRHYCSERLSINGTDRDVILELKGAISEYDYLLRNLNLPLNIELLEL